MRVQSSDEFRNFNEHQATEGNVVWVKTKMILVFVNYEVLGSLSNYDDFKKQ